MAEENKDQEISMAGEDKDQATKRIAIGKVYLKDFSFESPQSPAIFKSGEWQPETNLNLRSNHAALDGDQHEVLLTITIEAKHGESTIFLVEIQQAGLFEIAGYEGEEFNAIIGSFCPNILFPYAREAIAGIIQKGGFPEFVLQPINFEALYMQSRKQAAEQTADAAGAETH